MAYAIIRAKKLKTMGAVSRSAQHTFRMQPTPNADPPLTGRNRTVGAKGSEQILAALVRTFKTGSALQGASCEKSSVPGGRSAARNRTAGAPVAQQRSGSGSALQEH